MYCRNCGKKVEDKISFCPFCGTKVLTEQTTQQVALPSAAKMETQQKGTLWQDDFGPTTIMTEKQKKENFRAATILTTIAAVLMGIAAVLLIFLPLFGDSYLVTENEIDKIVVKKYSLLTFCIAAIKGVTSGGGYMRYFSYIYVVMAIWLIIVAIIEIKNAIVSLVNLIKFDSYYADQRRNPNAHTLNPKAVMRSYMWGNNLWVTGAMEIGFLYFFGGFDKIVAVSVVVIALFLLAGTIIRTVGETKAKKIRKTWQ